MRAALIRLANDAADLAARKVLVETEPRRPPYDGDDERGLIGSLADGVVSHEDLLPLQVKHFAIPWCATAFEAFADGGGLHGAESKFIELGYSTAAVQELHICVQESPILPVARVQQKGCPKCVTVLQC